jgi:hypothetical protein
MLEKADQASNCEISLLLSIAAAIGTVAENTVTIEE